MNFPFFGALRGRPRRPSGGSVAWKINSEVVLLLGWSPAILLQVAHPLVAAGVTEHSLFLTDPAGRPRRLRRTLNTMLDLTFGTPDEVDRAARGINRIHDRVQGELRADAGPFQAGRSYSAHDPELLRWVHCTVLDVFPKAYELYVGPLSPAEKDRYCAEASQVAPLLGIPDGYLPTSMAELGAYLDRMLASGEITPSAQSRVLAREIYMPQAPTVAAPFVWLAQLPMVGLLPPSIREAYGFPWDARRERLLRDTARLARPLLALTPTLLRHWPAARRAFARAPIGQSARPAGFGRAVLGGAIASTAILLANQAADRLGLTDLDLLRVLGLTFRDPNQAGIRPAGLVWFGLSGGLLVPSVYWLGFRLLGRSGAANGALFGAVHYVVSGAILAATTPRHPKRRVGHGRPLGGFVSRYGPLEWLANLTGHLLYGVAVGRAAR